MRTDELDYVLPRELIATEPPPERDGARLLVVTRHADDAPPVHRAIRDLPSLLEPGSLLVVNDTRVVPARLRGVKSSGGRVEILLLRVRSSDARRWSAIGRASKALRVGMVITIAPELAVRIDARTPDGVMDVELLCAGDAWSMLEAHGEVPLPPYMDRAPRDEDRERYQTVFARARGAIAAPTAGLHLSDRLLAEIAARGIERVAITLHVGAGTFAPVQTDDLDTHPMHGEWFDVPEPTALAVAAAKRDGRRVVAVGTTVVRALESWGGDPSSPRSGETRLLIQPGYTFRVVDQLLTNFHLPRSTLLALVMAFAGVAPIRRAYDEAIRARYRFYSYGDAMLLR